MSALQRPRHRFTVEEFDQMIAVGILREDDRVELVDGEVIALDTIGDPHMRCTDNVTRMLHPQIYPTYFVSVQNPIVLSPYDERYPDLAVYLYPRPAGRATPEITYFVVEVADSTLAEDRRDKLPRYAAAGIPEAWLINVAERTIERHTLPEGRIYREVRVIRAGESLASTTLPQVTFSVDAVFYDVER